MPSPHRSANTIAPSSKPSGSVGNTDLLESHQYAQDRTGKVTVRFRLKSDGTVTEMETTENTVGDVLGYMCQESVEESGPFAKWPSDMVRQIGSNYRVVSFTFYYY